MNVVEKTRAEIEKYFDPTALIGGSQFSSKSPTGKFKLVTAQYRQTKPDVDWIVTSVNVFDKKSSELVFEFFTDDDHFFHKWLLNGKLEYLVCAETLCGGQTVIDLTNRKMASFSPPEDGFISADFFLSPSGTKLAVVGCFWACPYEIKIYDFSAPLVLPLREIETTPLLRDDSVAIDWIDDESFNVEKMNGKFRSHSIGTIYP